jgi:Peptidase family M28
MARRSRPARIALALVTLVGLALVGAYFYMIRMPGRSHEGPLAALSEADKRLAAELERDVRVLASDIGERNGDKPEALARAESWIAAELGNAGYDVDRELFEVDGQRFANLIVERRGKDPRILVVGAHYDAAPGTPAANDNGSGTAALLALARRMAALEPHKTLRLVAYANEEPPHFKTEGMGSRINAARAKERGDRVEAMLSLETIGYYRDEPGTQPYPFPFSVFYPSEGNFLAVVGDTSSRALVHEVVGSFRELAAFPCEGVAAPGAIPGIDWSDHWSYWQQGWPAVMLTDTAVFRYPHYHEPTDTPDKLDYERLARVVVGVEKVILKLLDG